jgi:hypothetical protein
VSAKCQPYTPGAVATTFFGEKMFEILGMPRPEFVQSMQNNKMGSCMGAWFLGNTVSQNLLNTGAFEVYYDGEVIFSKLEQKRLPNIPEIMSGLETAMKKPSSLGGDPPEPEAIGSGEGHAF